MKWHFLFRTIEPDFYWPSFYFGDLFHWPDNRGTIFIIPLLHVHNTPYLSRLSVLYIKTTNEAYQIVLSVTQTLLQVCALVKLVANQQKIKKEEKHQNSKCCVCYSYVLCYFDVPPQRFYPGEVKR